jgi:DNA (cytosine-5)-methyltransferase 1
MAVTQQNTFNPTIRSFKIIKPFSVLNNETSIRRFTAVSLFCGAGGLDLGFEQAGFATLWANDFDSDACETHRAWSNANVVCGDISKIEASSIPDSDIILGGFPCQGFSLSGPRKIDDARNKLYHEYVRIVNEKRPAIFVGENVKGLLTMANGEIINAVIQDFSKCGYNVFYEPVNAKDYGVPQDRERVVIVGFRNDLNVNDFTIPPYKGESKNIRDALCNLPPFVDSDVSSAPFSSRYMSRNRKRRWTDVSYTIPAMAKQVTLHPDSPDMIKLGTDSWRFGDGGSTRRLSWRECAAIQTFPVDMEFFGDLTSKYKQIGNAVPVKLANHIAHSIRSILEERE